MAALILVTGPPGAGKSTVAAWLAERFDRCAVVSGDAFYAFITRGARTPWQSGASEQNAICTAAAGAACGRFAAAGFPVVFDGVVGPWFLPQFLAATGQPDIDYAILLPPEDVVVERVRTRVGHGFQDEAAARRMHRGFVRSGPEPRHVITDTGAPEQIAAEIRARSTAGRLRRRSV